MDRDEFVFGVAAVLIIAACSVGMTVTNSSESIVFQVSWTTSQFLYCTVIMLTMTNALPSADVQRLRRSLKQLIHYLDQSFVRDARKIALIGV